MIDLVKYKWIPFLFSGILFTASVILLIVYGLKPGIDFTGGSLVEVSFAHTRPSVAAVETSLTPLHLGTVVVQPTGDSNMVLRLRYISPEEHEQILSALRTSFSSASSSAPAKPVGTQSASSTVGGAAPDVLEQRIETIGPAISSTLRSRTLGAAIAVIVAIIAFISYAFRKVAKPVPSWRYGVAAVVALIHDVTITAGFFALLGHFYGVEVDIPFVVALLTVFGYSVNDTIVVFDRIRENLLRHRGESFLTMVNVGVSQTYVRSINTSFTVILVLLAMFLFGGASIHYFVLALLVGIFFGTYSSIFVASALLAAWQEWVEKRRAA